MMRKFRDTTRNITIKLLQFQNGLSFCNCNRTEAISGRVDQVANLCHSNRFTEKSVHGFAGAAGCVILHNKTDMQNTGGQATYTIINIIRPFINISIYLPLIVAICNVLSDSCGWSITKNTNCLLLINYNRIKILLLKTEICYLLLATSDIT